MLSTPKWDEEFAQVDSSYSMVDINDCFYSSLEEHISLVDSTNTTKRPS